MFARISFGGMISQRDDVAMAMLSTNEMAIGRPNRPAIIYQLGVADAIIYNYRLLLIYSRPAKSNMALVLMPADSSAAGGGGI